MKRITNPFIIMYLTVLFICSFIVNITQAVVITGLPKEESKTYSDFLNDVSMNIQLSGDSKYVTSIEHLSDMIYELYFPPTKSYLSKSLSSVAGNTRKYNSLAKSKNGTLKWESSRLRMPAFLFTLRDSLQNPKLNRNSNSTCINDMGRLITNLLSGKSWAFQFFDATGKPGPSLTKFSFIFVGNYDQCLAATAPYDSAEKSKGFKGSYFRTTFLTNMPLLRLQLGACLPDTCSSLEISSLAQEMVKGAGISGITITTAYAEKLPPPTEMTYATIAAISLLSIIGVFILTGTIIDVVVIKPWKEMDDLLLGNVNSHLDKNTSNGYQSIDESLRSHEADRYQPPIDNDETAPLIYSPRNHSTNTYTRGVPSMINPSNTVVKIFLAFSVYTNGKKLLNTKQNPGSLGAVHGIRFFSMGWVVLCHWYAFCIFYNSNSSEIYPTILKRWTFLPILNGYSSVDSFFTLSGLLTSYLTIKEMDRRNTASINWFKFYFHRFWRLTPPYMLSILIVLGFSQYLGHGPFWATTQPGDKVACEKNWWTNLLYINNIVRAREACFGHSWYLANDMQFFCLSPLFLVPFYFNKFYGLLSCLIGLLTTWITTGVLSTIHKWPTNTLSLHPVLGRAAQPEWFFHYYLVPWCRIGPFVVGILAGYVLAKTKGRPFKMAWWVVVLGWVTAVASGLAVVYGLRGDITGENPSSLGTAAFYNAVSRSAWGACVCWVVIACSAGYGGPINSLLSWSPFVVLGRLTYMIYLIHLCIGGLFYQNLGALLYFNDTTMVTTFLGVFMFVNMAAFIAVLTLESPMLGLEKIFLKRDSRN